MTHFTGVDSLRPFRLLCLINEFPPGIWSELLQYVNKVKATTGDLLTFTGPIIDADFNGLADSVLR